MMYKEQIDMAKMPRHIAVIMDGNGRWAKRHGFVRALGHKKGVEVVHNITEAAAELGLEYLTLYTFSNENWNRPKEEVDLLMNLLVDTIIDETPTLMENNVRLLSIGDMERLPERARRNFLTCMQQTSQNTGLKLIIALSYSARWEITNAVREAVNMYKFGGIVPEEIDEALVASLLTTRNIPDPDLLIRTSGELRLSNFLLWQLAYTELYFTDCLWPDFTVDEFYKAIINYQSRERRFGKTSEQIN